MPKGRSIYRGFLFQRYPDGCYAVVIGDRRGPCGNSRATALERFRKSGLIAEASSGR